MLILYSVGMLIIPALMLAIPTLDKHSKRSKLQRCRESAKKLEEWNQRYDDALAKHHDEVLAVELADKPEKVKLSSQPGQVFETNSPKTVSDLFRMDHRYNYQTAMYEQLIRYQDHYAKVQWDSRHETATDIQLKQQIALQQLAQLQMSATPTLFLKEGDKVA